MIVCAISTSFTAIDERVFQEICLVFNCTRNNAMSKHFSHVVIAESYEPKPSSQKIYLPNRAISRHCIKRSWQWIAVTSETVFA
ncbi:hypothetical protein SXCC_00475 [Gluconacetobacter sp. SXCC-1]|nr:hypothetical protein SXCC_00475 [Gluconacetobacter sp. SXCC-1]